MPRYTAREWILHPLGQLWSADGHKPTEWVREILAVLNQYYTKPKSPACDHYYITRVEAFAEHPWERALAYAPNLPK